MEYIRKETVSTCIKWDGTIDAAEKIQAAIHSALPSAHADFDGDFCRLLIHDYQFASGIVNEWVVIDPYETPRFVNDQTFQQIYELKPSGLAKRVTVSLYDNPIQVLVRHDGLTAAQAANMLQMAAEELYTEADFLKAGGPEN